MVGGFLHFANRRSSDKTPNNSSSRGFYLVLQNQYSGAKTDRTIVRHVPHQVESLRRRIVELFHGVLARDGAKTP